MSPTDTRQEIMTAARAMVQARGYSALSFRELAKEVGIKSASIHYHFPTKGDLGMAIARRYADDAVAYFEVLLGSGLDIGTCMQRYIAVFRAALENHNRACLYGIMAAERDDLPVEVRQEVDRFSTVNVRWLVQLMSREAPEADKAGLERRALAMFAAIEGAQLISRGRNDISVFDQTIEAYRVAGLLP